MMTVLNSLLFGVAVLAAIVAVYSFCKAMASVVRHYKRRGLLKLPVRTPHEPEVKTNLSVGWVELHLRHPNINGVVVAAWDRVRARRVANELLAACDYFDAAATRKENA